MKNYIDDIEKMTQNGIKMDKIVHWTGLNIAEVRKIMLENTIYPYKNDIEYRYFKEPDR